MTHNKTIANISNKHDAEMIVACLNFQYGIDNIVATSRAGAHGGYDIVIDHSDKNEIRTLKAFINGIMRGLEFARTGQVCGYVETEGNK